MKKGVFSKILMWFSISTGFLLLTGIILRIFIPNYTTGFHVYFFDPRAGIEICEMKFDDKSDREETEQYDGFLFVIDQKKVENPSFFHSHYFYPELFINEIANDPGILGQYHYKNALFKNNNDFDFSSGKAHIKKHTVAFSPNYFAVTVRDTPAITDHSLGSHLSDYLVYLDDETKSSRAIYKSDKMQRILYGTNEYVIIYNGQTNSYEYIDIATKNVLLQKQANLKTRLKDYYTELKYTKDGSPYVSIEKRVYFSKEKSVEICKLKIFDSAKEIITGDKRAVLCVDHSFFKISRKTGDGSVS